MSSPSAPSDRNLLFGVLALQLELDGQPEWQEPFAVPQSCLSRRPRQIAVLAQSKRTDTGLSTGSSVWYKIFS